MSLNCVMSRLVLVRIEGHTPLFGERWFHWPPMSSDDSKMVGSNPWARRYLAETMPEGPPPIIATVPRFVGPMGSLRWRCRTGSHSELWAVQLGGVTTKDTKGA